MSLLKQEDSLIPKLIEKMGIQKDLFSGSGRAGDPGAAEGTGRTALRRSVSEQNTDNGGG